MSKIAEYRRISGVSRENREYVKKIRNYWSNRGWKIPIEFFERFVEAPAQPPKYPFKCCTWCLQSDMKNGLPNGFASSIRTGKMQFYYSQFDHPAKGKL